MFGEEHIIISFLASYVLIVNILIVEEESCDQIEPNIPIIDTIVDKVPLRRLQRVCRFSISNDYMIYLQEYEYDICDVFNQVTYQEEVNYPQFVSWKKVMNDEINSV